MLCYQAVLNEAQPWRRQYEIKGSLVLIVLVAIAIAYPSRLRYVCELTASTCYMRCSWFAYACLRDVLHVASQHRPGRTPFLLGS